MDPKLHFSDVLISSNYRFMQG